MRLKQLTTGFVLGAACALLAASAISQQDHPGQDHPGQDHPGQDHPGQQMSPEQQAMMETWMKYTAPGDEHAKLAYFVGDWDVTSRMWMMPDQSPREEHATATMKWTLGKRFIEQTYDGTLMNMPYTGTGLTGYDLFKKKWVSTWASNMGTNIQYMEGTLDQTGTVWTYFGHMDEFLTGEHDKAVKYVVRIEDDNHFVFEVHDLTIVPGQTKVVELDYTRKN